MLSKLVVIDTLFEDIEKVVASYVVIAPNKKVAIVETGAAPALPHILAGLQAHGIEKEDVIYVAVTHVHLDHCGCVGSLLEHLPSAVSLVHPRGAPHLVNPRRLIEAAAAVHGEETLRRHYGQTLPVPKARVVSVNHGRVHCLCAC